jgi:hypothetical protein
LDVFDDGKYIFKWTINEADLTIKADIDVETIGWVGIGIYEIKFLKIFHRYFGGRVDDKQ